ncbi:hypothetical protein RHSIM_Rhsim05G0199100 [Rhododendron simsii]|uniref:Uncharacterized protein n=1 Tax=Rhododendron simsii TaxID=118357 RepID=A0A834LMH9_RHOSS|nr:hypothetical protein RHSIM_Rhsim05G0199100 [Rhododendron simsii]
MPTCTFLFPSTAPALHTQTHAQTHTQQVIQFLAMANSLMLLSLSRRRRQPRVRLQNVQPEVPVLPSTRQRTETSSMFRRRKSCVIPTLRPTLSKSFNSLPWQPLLSLSRRRRQPRVRLQNVQPEVPVLPSTRQRTEIDFLHVQAPEKPNECSICGLEFAIGQALGHRPTTDGKAEQRTGPVWSIRFLPVFVEARLKAQAREIEEEQPTSEKTTCLNPAKIDQPTEALDSIRCCISPDKIKEEDPEAIGAQAAIETVLGISHMEDRLAALGFSFS